MSPSLPTGWNEEHQSEDSAAALLQNFGYEYVPAEVLEAERNSLKEPVLLARLHRALLKLNPWLTTDNAYKAARAITSTPSTSLLDADEKLHTSLTRGISLDQDVGAGKKGQTVRFIDFDRPDRNEFLVTRQHRVLGSKKEIHPDLALFVNGIPLAIIRVQEPDPRRQVARGGRPADPALPGSRPGIPGPRRAEALRDHPARHWHLPSGRRLRHHRYAAALLGRVEGAVSAHRR